MINTPLIYMDGSFASDGYVTAKYTGDKKCKMEIRHDGNAQNFTVLDKERDFPLCFGDGEYAIKMYEQTEGEKYRQIPGTTLNLTVKLASEFAPYLHPNTYCMYDKSSMVYALMQSLKHQMQGKSDVECVEIIYRWVCDNTKYDMELAKTVESWWLPHPDRVIADGKTICWGYSSLVAAMCRITEICRIAGIPCRIVVGRAMGGKHAWNEIYTKTAGFVDGIRFESDRWNRMDITLMDGTDGKARDMVADDDNYISEYLG